MLKSSPYKSTQERFSTDKIDEEKFSQKKVYRQVKYLRRKNFLFFENIYRLSTPYPRQFP